MTLVYERGEKGRVSKVAEDDEKTYVSRLSDVCMQLLSWKNWELLSWKHNVSYQRKLCPSNSKKICCAGTARARCAGFEIYPCLKFTHGNTIWEFQKELVTKYSMK